MDTRSRLTVRVAGDSGDGVQLAGSRLAFQAGLTGNGLATLPTYPAEIRAPAGTAAGVSAFQLQVGDGPVRTPGDRADVLCALNPAALAAHLPTVARGGIVIVDPDAFTPAALRKAGIDRDPRSDGTLDGHRVLEVPLTVLAVEAAGGRLPARDARRGRNLVAVGLLLWLLNRPSDPTEAYVRVKFAADPDVAAANVAAVQAGYHYPGNAGLTVGRIDVPPADLPPGRYRMVTGNQAVAYGLVAAAHRAGLPLFYGSYPITPASDILHTLAGLSALGVTTFQAEDEIAAVGATIGAAFAGSLAVTGTSGPGMALKAEAVGLAVMTELPMVVVDVQRAGPSTGMPTRPEQADLNQAIAGRHGMSPLPVLAARSPAEAFEAAYDACRLAIELRHPVILLSDSHIGNSSEPWRLPDLAALDPIDPAQASDPATFSPYRRDPATLARPWAPAGTAGMAHRLGGLEKDAATGEVSHDPGNHARMTGLRAGKVDRAADRLPKATLTVDRGADVLLVGWGSTYGALTDAADRLADRGTPVDLLHLRHLHPLPHGVAALLAGYRTVVVCEANDGQLLQRLRAATLLDLDGMHWLYGTPLTADAVIDHLDKDL